MLSVKVANIDQFKASEKAASAKGKRKKRVSAVNKRVDAREVKLEQVEDARKRSVEAMKVCKEWAADASARLVNSVLRIGDIEESAEVEHREAARHGIKRV